MLRRTAIDDAQTRTGTSLVISTISGLFGLVTSPFCEHCVSDGGPPAPSLDIVNMRAICSAIAFVFAAWICCPNVSGNPIGTSVIDCASGNHLLLPPVEEGYFGPVEVVTGIPADVTVKLVDYLFASHLELLELQYTEGSSNATVQTTKELDAEALSNTGGEVFYSVMCSGKKMNNTRILKITDINDNPPIFQNKEYSATISESLAVSSSVVKVWAVDADVSIANNRIAYSILTPSEYFEIKSDGIISLKKRLNFNTGSQYTLTVEARDSGSHTDVASVFISVVDFDNMNPYFKHSLYTVAVPEGETWPLLDVLPEPILAKDGDTGIDQTVLYSIHDVVPGEYRGHFTINQTTGVISVAAALDREEIDRLTINIKATQVDDTLKTADAVVSVEVQDVNDNPPEFDTSSYSATVLENSPNGSFLLKVTITDKDKGQFNGTLQVLPESAPFSVSADGILTVRDSSLLDCEKNTNFIFQIEAKENNPPFFTASAMVNVTLLDENDNSPQFGSPKYEAKIFGNQTVDMVVTTVTAEDPDQGPNGQVKFDIYGGNQDGYFAIHEVTGIITLKKEIPLEENRFFKFSLYVTARDEGIPPRSSLVLVEVFAPGDTKPQFLSQTYRCSVEEEREAPVALLKVGFLSVTPSLEVNLQVLTENDKFAISSDGVLSTLVKLNYEAQKNYSVRVSLSDGTNRDETTVLVEVTDINDNDPMFKVNSVEVTVLEDTDVGHNITEMVATDADGSFNGKVSYSFSGGEGKFGFNPESGNIFLVRKLDREIQSTFRLHIVAQDQGQPPRSSTGTVLINVTDVNDNPPRFSSSEYRLNIPENATVGQTVYKFAAEDLDEGLNALITYQMIQQNPATDPAVFSLNPETGDLHLEHPLDFEMDKAYTLVVMAADGANPKLNGTCTMLVQVEDVNDNEPQFAREKYDVSVYENLPSGAAIVSIEVTDKDEAGFLNGHFIMNSDIFSINKQGTVFLNSNATLDREKQDNYLLQLVAVDLLTGGLSATVQVNVTVLDINDNNPQFLPLPDPIQVLESNNTPEPPWKVCQVSVVDLDRGDNGRVTLSLSSTDPKSPFQITEDGTVLAVSPLDREAQDLYEIMLVASDNGTPQRTNFSTLRISITDINDNEPVFSQKVYSTSILVKDAKEGDKILTLSATDKDTGNNSLIVYSLTTATSLLVLDSDTGVLTLTSEGVNVKVNTMLELTAVAEDRGQPSLHSSATVLVALQTTSLTPGTVFERSVYNFSVLENEPKGTSVGRVTALTGNSSVQVNYTLLSQTDIFSVDDQGRISMLQVLDKETQEWYSMTVAAVDTRTPPYTAVAMVTVQVGDVNEAPEFNRTSYSAKTFSIAPYKQRVVQVKATDPDAGDSGELLYSLQDENSHFDVEPSTGQVYVVSAQSLEGLVTLYLKASDYQGLTATTKVEVTVVKSSSSDVVTISVNQPVNVVEKKVPQVETALDKALQMTVTVVDVWAAGDVQSRSTRSDEKTYISFVATDSKQAVVPAEQVRSKLESQKEQVKAQLETVFGSGLELRVEDMAKEKDPHTASSQAVLIALGVLLGLSVVTMVVLVVMIVRFTKLRKSDDSLSKKNLCIDSNCMMENNSVSTETRNSPHSLHGIGRTGGQKDDDDSDSSTDNSHTSAF